MSRRARRQAIHILIVALILIWFAILSWPTYPTIILILARRLIRGFTGGRLPYQDCTKLPHWYDYDTWYGIDLAPGHSFEQHKRVVSRDADLEAAVMDVRHFRHPLLGNITIYDAKTEDETLIAAILADHGVLMVECDTPLNQRLIDNREWSFIAHEKRLNWKSKSFRVKWNEHGRILGSLED